MEGWARISSAHGRVMRGRKMLYSVFWDQTFGLLAVSEERNPHLGCHLCGATSLHLPVTKPVIEQLTVINISLLPTH